MVYFFIPVNFDFKNSGSIPGSTSVIIFFFYARKNIHIRINKYLPIPQVVERGTVMCV